MDIQITKSQLRLLCGGLIGLASLVMQACDMEQDKDVRESICGNWESVESKPDLLIYKEGNAYKVTVFKRSGISRKLKPETYLLQMEDNGNLFMNTGFRIDVAYNEETDILTFSPNGDYIRATPAADNRPVQHCAKHHKHLEECGAYLDHRNEYGQELSGDRQDLRAGKEVL